MKRALALLSLAGLTPVATAQSFGYPDFTSVSGLTLNGNAGSAGGVLNVTPSAGGQVGSVWFTQPVAVTGGFDTTFEFSMDLLNCGGADGMAFVIHNDPRGVLAIAETGSQLGYGSDPTSPLGVAIANSLAIELDTWLSAPFGDVTENSLSIHTNGTGENDVDESFSIGASQTAIDLSDGSIHTLRIRYVPGMLEVFLDDLVTPEISAAYDITTGGTFLGGGTVGGLNLINGTSAFVGLTASTGGCWETHDVVSWEWGGGLGTSYCLSLPNSSGNSATILASGSTSVAAADFALSATNLPPGVPGIFYYGQNQILTAFGDGFRCAGGAVQRLPFNAADGAGVLIEPNVFNFPLPNLPIVPGGTYNFQAWFRDAPAMMTGFNLSNGVSVTFVP